MRRKTVAFETNGSGGTALRQCRRTGWLILLAVFLVRLSRATENPPAVDLSVYLYEETRNLVERVETSADRLCAQGTNAFPSFKSQYEQDERLTLFVYDVNGICAYHDQYPDFVGQDLHSFKDLHGRPVGSWSLDIGRQPEAKARGWVFYYWREADAFDPKWKASYIRKAVAPDGRVYIVGCGVVDMKIEKAFVRERVDMAAERLKTSGREAFKELEDPASKFNVLDTLVFVLDRQGHALVDPAFPGGRGRSLVGFEDVTGKRVFQQALARLGGTNEVWTQYLWPMPNAVRPSRKLLYLRKVTRGDEEWVVGASFFMATPIWMKL
jgi:signal transduction histidine kinase